MVDYSKWDNLDSDESGDEPDSWPESKAAPWHGLEPAPEPSPPADDFISGGAGAAGGEPEEMFYLDNPTRNVASELYPQYCIQCGLGGKDTNEVRAHAEAAGHFICIACLATFPDRASYDAHKQEAHNRADELEDDRMDAAFMLMGPVQDALERELMHEANLGVLHVVMWALVYHFGLWSTERDAGVLEALKELVRAASKASHGLAPGDPKAEPYYQLLSPAAPGAGMFESLMAKGRDLFWEVLEDHRQGAWMEYERLAAAATERPVADSAEEEHFMKSNYYRACMRASPGGDVGELPLGELRTEVEGAVPVAAPWAPATE